MSYADYLLAQYERNPAWTAEHAVWLRRFGVRGRVLDAGSGLGHLAEACLRAGCDAVGIEMDRELALAGRARLGFARVVQADACALPFGEQQFDWVLSNQVIEHVTRPDLVLREAYRVLVPGGRLLLTTPNRRTHLATRRPRGLLRAVRGEAKSDPTHVHEFVPRELLALVRREGFVVRHHEALGRLSRWPLVRVFAGGTLVLAERPPR